MTDSRFLLMGPLHGAKPGLPRPRGLAPSTGKLSWAWKKRAGMKYFCCVPLSKQTQSPEKGIGIASHNCNEIVITYLLTSDPSPPSSTLSCLLLFSQAQNSAQDGRFIKCNKNI